MKYKTCKKCGKTKRLNDFYSRKYSSDGKMGSCKSCMKEAQRKRYHQNMENEEWRWKERRRSRERYYRLNYRKRFSQSPEERRRSFKKHMEKYPEKLKAKREAQKIDIPDGCHRHHWSYNDEHLSDIVILNADDHYKAHRFIIYDSERKMFRAHDTNELLDTRERHVNYIDFCIKNKPD